MLPRVKERKQEDPPCHILFVMGSSLAEKLIRVSLPSVGLHHVHQPSPHIPTSQHVLLLQGFIAHPGGWRRMHEKKTRFARVEYLISLPLSGGVNSTFTAFPSEKMTPVSLRTFERFLKLHRRVTSFMQRLQKDGTQIWLDVNLLFIEVERTTPHAWQPK